MSGIGRDRALASQRDRDRNRAWTHGERHGQRIERVWRSRARSRDIGRLLPVRIVLRVQNLPAQRGDDETARNAHHWQSKAKEFEHVGANQQRSQQKEKAISRNLKRYPVPLGIGTALGQAEEDRCHTDRIHDRKQTGIDKQE